jgi:hypothetical protein
MTKSPIRIAVLHFSHETVTLVEPTEPFLGTVRLDALKYDNVVLRQFYPFGSPKFPA